MYEYIAKCKVVDLPKQKELQDLNNDEIEGEIADHLKKLISSCEKETAGEWRIISHTVQLLKTQLVISVLLRRSTRPSHL